MKSRLVTTALLLAPLTALHATDAPKPEPNIIFILFDDLGYGQPKCYREGTEFKTPNLDRLAAEGMRFSDAHSAASVCTPTRYGLLTGRYPSRIGQDKVLHNVEEVENQPLLAKKTMEFLNDPARKQKPFFLYLPLCPPHTPVAPAPEFIGQSGVKGKESQYGDWIYQGDHMLGQVLEALDRLKLADNTLIIASADNGAAGRPYPPLRAAKTSIYEGGHRVPFLARWPGRIKAGSVSDDTICLNDLMATSAEIIGVKLPDNAGEDSVSILPVLLGTAKGPVREASIHQSSKGDLAIRQGPWKLIFHKNGNRELYNLQTDLGEANDVAEAHPEVVARLTTLTKKHIADGRSTLGAPQKNEAAMAIDESPRGKRKKAGKANK